MYAFTDFYTLVDEAVLGPREGWPQVERVFLAGFRFFEEHPEFVRLSGNHGFVEARRDRVDRLLGRHVRGIDPQAHARHRRPELRVQVAPDREHVLVAVAVAGLNHVQPGHEFHQQQRPGSQPPPVAVENCGSAHHIIDDGEEASARERIREVQQAVPKEHETINALDGKCAEIFRGHPFYQPPDLVPMLRRLVESPDLKLKS